MSSLYERDFYGWAIETAAALRRRDLDCVDLNAIAEELEDLGRSEKRELRSRLTQLMVHLLKWEHQFYRRTAGCALTVKEQRRSIQRVLAENPSLVPQLDAISKEAYEDAVIKAAKQTGFRERTFPPSCPWTFEALMSRELDPLKDD